METYVIITSSQSAFSNTNTVYGIMQSGKVHDIVCVAV